jgi:CHAD domain-containing protein
VFDDGHILAAGRSRPILEVEHELKNGKPSALSSSCLEFLDRNPCAIGVEGKAARGYRLWQGDTAQPVYQKKVRIARDTRLPEALHRIFANNFSHALANLPALADTGVPASIHQMRVGLRRLRSAFYAFKPVLSGDGVRDLNGGTKRIFALLGEVREADVFLADTLPNVPANVLPARGRRLLERVVAAERDAALARLQNCLTGKDFARLVVEIDTWIEGRSWLTFARPVDRLLVDRPIGEFAAARLQNMHRKFIKLGRKAIVGTLDDWHQVRIMAKKLRYSGEPLLAALDDEVDPDYAKNLAQLQETLGHINDSHSARAFLERIRASVPARSRASFAEAAAYCIGWGAASAQAASRVVADGWRAFEATGPSARR